MSGRRGRGSPLARDAGVVLRGLLRAGKSREQAVTGARDPVFVDVATRAGVEAAVERMPERVRPRPPPPPIEPPTREGER